MGAEQNSGLESIPHFERREVKPIVGAPISLHEISEQKKAREKFAEHQRVASTVFPNPDSKGRIFPQILGLQDGESVVDHLMNCSGDPERVEEIFGPKGEFTFSDRVDLMSMDPDSVGNYLRGSLQNIYELCELSPDGLSEEGFNRHGNQHHNQTRNDVNKLLISADVEDMQLLRGNISAMVHDIGYIFNKEAHALVGARMLPVVFPRLSESYAEENGKVVSNLEIIQRIVANHDTDTLRVNMASWNRLPEEARLKAMRDFLGPEGLAVLIADKVDVGKKRISNNINARIVKKDKHAEVNLLGKSRGISFFGDRAEWILEFDPKITDYHKKANPTWARRLAQDMDKGRYSTHFHGWIDDFNKLYPERTVTTVEATMALFPGIEGVKVVFNDLKTGEESSRFFERGNLDNDIALYRQANSQIPFNK